MRLKPSRHKVNNVTRPAVITPADDGIRCPKCRGPRDTRVGQSDQGWALEEYCRICGWVKHLDGKEDRNVMQGAPRRTAGNTLHLIDLTPKKG